MTAHPAVTACKFADLLCTPRHRAQLTQQALAAATKLLRSLISELENARSIIRLAHAKALADRLAVTTGDTRQCSHASIPLSARSAVDHAPASRQR
jgi:transcriptional regulator with XRE-family HTH domain